MKLLMGLLVLLVPMMVEAKCFIPANKIEEVAKRIKWRDADGNEDNSALIRADAEGELGEGGSQNLDYEAFVRPDVDGTFQPLPIPLFIVEMEKARDSIYLCAHFETDHPENMLIYVYFLRDDLIKPVTPVPLPLTDIKNLFWGPLRKTPFVLLGIPLTVAQKVQAVITHIFGDLTKFGVDRVRITGKEMQLYSGGNPAQFESYVFRQVIPLEKAEKKN